MRRSTCAFALAAMVAAAGCGPPSETRTRVAVEGAPLLLEPSESSSPRSVLHAGDLVDVVRVARPHLAWSGSLDGAPASRAGECVEVRRAVGEPTGFVFRADLDGDARAPTADWLCHRMQ